MSGDAHVRICESLGVKFPRATRLVLYFNDGSVASPSWQAAKAVTWGYRKVYFFDGGAKAWKEAGYPVGTGP